MIGRFVGDARSELLKTQNSAGIVDDGPVIDHLTKVMLGEGRIADEISDHAGVGKNPIVAAWQKASGRNATDNPACRFPVSRSCKEKFAGSHCRRPAG